jgi:hypothetical protein
MGGADRSFLWAQQLYLDALVPFAPVDVGIVVMMN